MPKFAVFDIEAKNWVNFQIMGFFDGEKYTEFYGVPHFLDVVLGKKYRSYRIYAHFAGRYDFLFLLEDLLIREGYKVEIIEAGSRIIRLKVSKNKDTWYFLDSFALMPAKLSDLCEAFNVAHKKQTFDHETGDYLSSEGRLYLRDDCFGLYEVIEAFSTWGKNDGKLKMTAASQAMYIFRRDFLKEPFKRLPEHQEEFIRKTYFGGRCEIFKMYGKNLYYYDVNSMYPFVMLADFPLGVAVSSRGEVSGKVGFYEVEVNIPKKKKIPFIPYVLDGKLLFPVGRFTSFITSAEIGQLKREGIPYKILRGLVFPEAKPIFRDYVKFFYNLKASSKKGSAENFISKLALNSLYGKTGQRRTKETIVKVGSFKEIIDGRMRPYFEELGLYKKETVSQSHFIQPQLASYVTSLARMELYRLIQEAGEDNVYYCDTDSVVTSKKLNTGLGLGEIKLEYEIEEAIFLQPKMYSLKLRDGRTITRMKGFNNQKVDFNEFKKALFTKNIKTISRTIERMTGWKECLGRHGRVFPSRISHVKTLSHEYDKRKINDDFSTIPLDTNL